MPLQATSGAASYDGFGGGVAAVPNYIEDVFSTFLFNDATQTINNGIDLAGKGGLIWYKSREGTSYHRLTDTARGAQYALYSNATNAQQALSEISSFNSNGFGINAWDSGEKIVSWTFRKQPKFFDVVTFSGNATAGRAIPHNLGSVPGCIIVKKTSGSDYWAVYHRSTGTAAVAELNTSNAFYTGVTNIWGSGSGTTPTSTEFYLGSDSAVNGSGSTYVAYLFAHNAGGFGLAGTDNVISCGSYSGGSGTTYVTLGYEPQLILKKNATSTGNWVICDNMRGMPTGGNSTASLFPNTSGAETVATDANGYLFPTATGFGDANANSGQTYIYIAIRRGPMKVPTDGTKVFVPVLQTGNGTGASITTAGFAPDSAWVAGRNGANYKITSDKLIGTNKFLQTVSSAAEVDLPSPGTQGILSWDMKGVTYNGYSLYSGNGNLFAYYLFGRAPSTFDEVCYTGNGTGSTQIAHNLGVAPTLVIVKQRSGSPDRSWWVLTTAVPQLNILNDTSAANAYGVPANLFGDSTYNNYIAPTATTLTLSPSSEINNSGSTYVAYLWATNAGVTKVGTYTGNGSSQTINCGFTGGARFVMIKATSTTGNWLVADSARGIVSGNDPALYLNSTSAEVTGFDWIDADNSGFIVNETSTIAANTNGVQYLFLAYA